jgi:hypothetical protein
MRKHLYRQMVMYVNLAAQDQHISFSIVRCSATLIHPWWQLQPHDGLPVQQHSTIMMKN